MASDCVRGRFTNVTSLTPRFVVKFVFLLGWAANFLNIPRTLRLAESRVCHTLRLAEPRVCHTLRLAEPRVVSYLASGELSPGEQTPTSGLEADDLILEPLVAPLLELR